METVVNYVRTDNSKKIICFYGKRNHLGVVKEAER